MAIIVVECSGVNWQADFEPLVPRLYQFFNACFRGDKEQEELTHKAVLLFMKNVRNKWVQGATLRLATRYVVLHAWHGQDIIPRPIMGRQSVKAHTNGEAFHRLMAKADRVMERVHFKDCLEQLTPRERTIVKMYLARYTYPEIERGLAVGHNTVCKVLHKTADMLTK